MYKTALFIFTGAAIVVACNNAPKSPTPGVETTAGEVVSNKDVVTRITDARCEHANECHEFGTDKKFKDEAGCKSEVSHDIEPDFQAKECPHGVRTERLNTCLTKIKSEPCGLNVQDKIQKGDACRKGSLCID